MALAACALAACAGEQPMLAARHPPPPDPKTELPALEQRIYTLVEAARMKADPAAKPLALDQELTAVARAHSEDMARQHLLVHRMPDGETAATIIMARDASFQGLLGENLAAQYYSARSGVDPNDYAKRFVASWVDSKSHLDNLAFPDYARTGIGAAIDGDKVYITQLFAADIVPPGKTASGRDARQVATYSDPETAKADKPFAQRVPLRGAEDATPSAATPR